MDASLVGPSFESLKKDFKDLLNEVEATVTDEAIVCSSDGICTDANKRCASWGTIAIDKFDDFVRVFGLTLNNTETKLEEFNKSVVSMIEKL
jgi:hypothetical protein